MIFNQNKKMKIALIQCPAWGRYNPPFALALLSAYLRCNGREVYAFDLNNELFHMLEEGTGSLWQLSNEAFWENKVRMAQFAVEHSELIDSFVDRILNSGCGIIGFSTFNSSKELSLIFARKIKLKDKSKIIIFGGPQAAPHMQGPDIIQHEAVDAIGVGEGEVSLLEFVELAETYREPRPCKGVWLKKDGKIIQGGERELIPDLNILPFADFSDFSLEGYEQPFKLPVYFSRGCVNRCVYCNENLFWHGHRTRNGERVHEEICFQVSRHKGVYNFEFTDSLVNGNVGELSRLADLLIRNGPEITWGGRQSSGRT